MMLITHDLGVVAETCDKVAVMYAGEIVEYGTAEDIFDHRRSPSLHRVGLFDSIPNLDEDDGPAQPHRRADAGSHQPAGRVQIPPTLPLLHGGRANGRAAYTYEEDGHRPYCVQPVPERR